MNIMPLFAQRRCRWRSFWLIPLMPLTLCGQIAAAGIGGLNNGTYDAFDCAAEISDERILIADDNLSFYESSCQLSAPQDLPGLPGAFLVDAACSGEGQSWTTRFILMQTRDGGLAFLQEGWGGYYRRCD